METAAMLDLTFSVPILDANLRLPKAPKVTKPKTPAAPKLKVPTRAISTDAPVQNVPVTPTVLAGFYPLDRVTYIGRQHCPECDCTTRYIAGDLLRYAAYDAAGNIKTTRALHVVDPRFSSLPRHVETLAEIEETLCPSCIALAPVWDLIEFGDTDVPLQQPLPFVEALTSGDKPVYTLTAKMREHAAIRKTLSGVRIHAYGEDE